MAGQYPAESTRKIRCLFSRRLLADPLELSPYERNFGLSSNFTLFGATARFLRKCYEDQKLPNRVLRNPISAFGLRTQFSAEPVPKFFREHSYGLATQSFAPWFREQLLGLFLTLVGGTLLVVVLYAVFRHAPRTWWIWGTIVMIFFSGTLLLIAPVYIEPLFNTYKPLTDPKIRDPILAMARANEIPVKQVFEVDASRQTTRVSANVSGLLGTTRVALNDNLLKQCTLPEIRAVMAHEMGHYILNHGAKLLTYLGILTLIGFALTRIIFDAAVRRWGEKWRVRGIADPAGLPLLALIFSTLVFFATPILNTVVRITEREADAFGINTSREPDGMAKAALHLSVYRKLDPTPLEEFIFFDHPSGRARIRMAMDWKAANLPAGELHASENQPATH